MLLLVRLQVMGFSSREECTPESLRAARKAKALAVHPDKVGHDHPGANQAAGRVNKVSWQAVSHSFAVFAVP
jgi:hypothetical protein